MTKLSKDEEAVFINYAAGINKVVENLLVSMHAGIREEATILEIKGIEFDKAFTTSVG